MVNYNSWNEACEYIRQQDVKIEELKTRNKILELKITTLLAKQKELEYTIEVLGNKLRTYELIDQIESNEK